MTVRSDICNECPFRKNAGAGWLGDNTPEDFSIAATSDTSVSCHLMVDQDQEHFSWEKDEAAAPRCRGALAMMSNMCKVPINKEMAKLRKSVLANPEVFAHSVHFIAFHNASSFKSWKT